MTATIPPKKGLSSQNLFNHAQIDRDVRKKDANAVVKDVVRGLQLSEYFAAQSPAKHTETAKALVAEILPARRQLYRPTNDNYICPLTTTKHVAFHLAQPACVLRS